MTRNEFEAAARKQNQDRAAEVLLAREVGAACDLIDMLAFGTTFCRTHRVMGTCTFGLTERRQS